MCLSTITPLTATDPGGRTMANLEMLWLELTNQCNLACNHCYAESGPDAGQGDTLSADDYRRLLDEASKAGCRRVQFIGGEPTLHPNLCSLIAHARHVGFTSVEVFTNLIKITEAQIDCFKTHGVSIATSIYGSTSEAHDAITLRKGSFDRTVRNIVRLLEGGLSVRAGFIEAASNKGMYQETRQFLEQLGNIAVGFDRVRQFGRGRTDGPPKLESLCGACAGQTLCISSSGQVSPCIMSRFWSFGSASEANLESLLDSPSLAQLRADIERASRSTTQRGTCYPDSSNPSCYPNAGCSPDSVCGPKCQPNWTDLTHPTPH